MLIAIYGIGTVARLAQVSVRTLRYYDELGLLRPAWVDPDTGYRWYSPDQLPRLHRIIALRDLGVRLADIVALLDEPVTVEELRGILRLRQAEGRQRMAAEADRLARVEARLQQLEEDSMAAYDIITKRVDAVWVAAAGEDVADHGQIGFAEQRLWPRIDKALADCQVEQAAGPSYAIDTASGNPDAPVRVTCAVPVPEGATIDRDGVTTTLLPARDLVAATVIHGDPNYPEAFDALMGWADSTAHKRAGEGREVYLDCDGPRDTWVVELQVALEPRAPGAAGGLTAPGVEWYATPGPLTDLGRYAQRLPRESSVAEARDLVQGLVVHDAHRHRYGIEPEPARSAEENLRSVTAMLDRVSELDAGPLDQPRRPQRRLVGSCRTFAVMLCALLRHTGVPARARCGFLAYFGADEYAWDHWVCEYWNDAEARWQLVDAQLDDAQITGLAAEGYPMSVDPLDVRRDEFLVAGSAWRLCRQGERDPARFGLGEHLNGMWFIRDNVIRDLAALNKIELLPRDGWGRINDHSSIGTDPDNAIIDAIAAATATAEPDTEAIKSIYLNDPELQAGHTVSFFGDAGIETHSVPELEHPQP